MCWVFPAAAQSDTTRFPYIKYAGIHAGTQGLGVSATVPVSNAFSVETAVSFLPFNRRVSMTYNSYKTRSYASARFSNVHMVLDWSPFHASGNALRHIVASAGIGYFFEANGYINTRLADKYYYGEIAVAPDHVGVLTTKLSWDRSVAPYLGAGFRHFELIPRFGMGITFGSYFLRKPDVSIVGTRLLEGNESNAPIVQENIKNYRFLPVLQLNFSYQIK